MAAVQFELTAESRTLHTKCGNRRLRRDDKIPIILYGAGKDPVSLSLQHNHVNKALENEAFYTRIITLNVPGEPAEKAIVRDIQRHAYKPRILHMDFQRVSAHEKLHIRIPLHFINEENCPGVKHNAGIVSHNLIDVEISCLPADIPEFIEVDLLSLDIGDSIHLSQLTLPTGVELVAFSHGDIEEHDVPVVAVQAPRKEEIDAPVEVPSAEVPATAQTATPAAGTPGAAAAPATNKK